MEMERDALPADTKNIEVQEIQRLFYYFNGIINGSTIQSAGLSEASY